jgi:hypothetical protein
MIDLEQAQTQASAALDAATQLFYDCAEELKKWSSERTTPESVIAAYEEACDGMDSARQAFRDAHAAWTAESCRRAGISL